jgi:2-keto-4-pentenoate hydratase
MPLTQADVDDLASRLRTAELDRRPVQPVTEVFPGLAAADAYRIQRGFVDLRRRDEGSRLTGRKIGATNPVIQSLLGVDMPDYGHLLDVAWLANALGEFGEGLESGQLVLSGALTSAPLARPGDLFQAHFAGLGTITCSFDGPAEPGDG